MKNKCILSLTTKKKLAAFLECSTKDLKYLISDKGYKVYTVKGNHGKIRQIETPYGENDILRRAHEIIKNELRDEPMPEWVYSRRGKDYVKNAAYHARPDIYLINMDITKFYPSCKRKYVRQLFADKNFYGLNMDIADILSKILTYDDHIPTGSPVSSYLAFWSYYNCFDEIYRFMLSKGYKMSLYVDDMTFSSSKNLPLKYVGRIVSGILTRYGLKLNDKKTKISAPYQEKTVTGAKISVRGEISPTDELLKKIAEEKSHPENEINYKKLQGLETVKRYIESHNN